MADNDSPRGEPARITLPHEELMRQKSKHTVHVLRGWMRERGLPYTPSMVRDKMITEILEWQNNPAGRRDQVARLQNLSASKGNPKPRSAPQPKQTAPPPASTTKTIKRKANDDSTGGGSNPKKTRQATTTRRVQPLRTQKGAASSVAAPQHHSAASEHQSVAPQLIDPSQGQHLGAQGAASGSGHGAVPAAVGVTSPAPRPGLTAQGEVRRIFDIDVAIPLSAIRLEPDVNRAGASRSPSVISDAVKKCLKKQKNTKEVLQGMMEIRDLPHHHTWLREKLAWEIVTHDYNPRERELQTERLQDEAVALFSQDLAKKRG